MKNSNETIGNRTRDLPNCGAVPQPTAPPRVTKLNETKWKFSMEFFEIFSSNINPLSSDE
jgi:hypothetical protein